jgi:hypothetical protein
VLRSIWLYRDKKVVGVFCAFFVPLLNWKDIVTLKEGGQITKLIRD